MKYREAYRRGVSRLSEAMPDNPDVSLDARLLLEAVCGTEYRTLLADGDEREVSPEEKTAYDRMLTRREARVPVAYILGEQDFMGLPFIVTSDVLIPNQDTENLVEEAMKEVHDGFRILDLCTGSGCILLSLLHYSNETTGIGTDLSEAALKVAKENSAKLGLSGRASFLPGDLYGALGGGPAFCGSALEPEAVRGGETSEENAGTEDRPDFDLIVSNPPYIPTDVIPSLMPEVAEQEPRMALDGGEDGLVFYRRILSDVRHFLRVGGVLLFETGFDEAGAVAELMRAAGFADIRILKDYGGQDRVVRGELTLPKAVSPRSAAKDAAQ